MRDRMVGLLEKAEAAIAVSAGVIDGEALDYLSSTVADLRFRLDYPEEILVAAFVGGTGSGKSSLLNAMVGSDVAEVGGIRPTTDRPLAVTSPANRTVMSGYLEAIGVSDRHVGDLPEWLVLVDLPDTDSVVVEHRMQVDELLARLDVLIWVLDPEKYRDASLHHRYLRPLCSHEGKFIFVLNQIDRLDPVAASLVLTDLEAALLADGITHPRIVPASASDGFGPPRGVDELLRHLEELARDPEMLHNGLLTALRRCVGELAGLLGDSLDFERRSNEAAEFAVDKAVAGDLRGAGDVVTSFFLSLAAEATEPTTGRLLELASNTPAVMQEGVALEAGQLRRLLDKRLMHPARIVLRSRSEAMATIAELTIFLEELPVGRGLAPVSE